MISIRHLSFAAAFVALLFTASRASAQTNDTATDAGLAPLPSATTTAPPPPPPVHPQPQPGATEPTQQPGTVNAQQVNPGENKPERGASSDDLVLGTAGGRAVGVAPAGVNYSNFMDTRLTWTFGDDDVLHQTGALIPLSPSFNIGDRQQYRMFFDSLNSRFAGRENLTHLVLYKKMPGFIKNLTTEAAVVLRFDLSALAANTGSLNQALYDSGSYIRLFYKTGGTDAKPEGLSATFLPLDADRLRVGYLYDITWGGSASYINQSIFPSLQGSAPGAKLQYDNKRFYAYGAFKTATIVQPQQVINPGGENDVETVNVGESNYGFLGGAGFDFTKNFRMDVSGGYFQQGRFDLEDVRGLPVYTYGGAARVVVHDHMPVPQSVDLVLYRNDPNAPMTLFALPVYTPEVTKWSVSVEGDVLGQHLKNYDVEGKTKDDPAYAIAAQGVLETGYLRLSVTGIMRNLQFVVRNVPGFIPFQSLPSQAQTDPELFGAVAADYNIPKLHLTPGIGGGVQLPSTFKSDIDVTGLGVSSRTIVVRSQGDESILPFGQDRRPIVQARVSLRWDLSTILSAVIWAQLVYDNNATLVVTDPNEGTASLRVFQDPFRLGFAASLQARY
ncbi:MAG TPA: hypothetical protein VGH28_23755 [Polyangiaceae bacterium]|jgi:hypothetical protein